MNAWEKLCEHVRYYTIENHNTSMNEEGFECHYREYLHDIFGWGKDEINRQYSVYFGHEKQNPKRADIVALYGDYPSVVFELKWKVALEDGDARLQLFSYMKQLEAEFGILTNGVAIQLFYKPLGRKGGPWKIFGSNYNPLDKTGVQLGEMLTRSNYNEEKMRNFCDELLKRAEKKRDEVFKYQTERPNFLMEEQMDKQLDKKVMSLIEIYQEWLKTSGDDYIERQEAAAKWVRANVFDNTDLNTLGIVDYRRLIREIPTHLTNLKEGACRTLYKNSLNSEGKRKFLRAINFINKANQKDCFEIMNKLTTDEKYRIKGLGQSFWSEMLRCKFPNMPLVNSKTVSFFQKLELYIGINPTEQHESVYYCYSRWIELYKKNVSMLELSHMEHFALATDEGKKTMNELFNSSDN